MTFIQQRLTIEQMVGITTTPPTVDEQLVQIYRQFYAGSENVVLSDRQQNYILSDQGLPTAISNTVRLVCDKIKNRTKIKRQGAGIKPGDDASADFADAVTDWWLSGNVDSEQGELMTYTLRDGQAALFVEWVGDAGGLPLVAARPVWVGDNNNGVRFHTLDVWGDLVEFASYRWEVPVYSEDGKTITDVYVRLNIYEPGFNGSMAQVYRYYSAGDDDWQPLDDEMILNETGQPFANPQELITPFIPVIRFQNSDGRSEVEDILHLEELRQKALIDVDMAADQHAMPITASDTLDVQVDSQGNPIPIEVTPGTHLIAPGAKRIEPANLELMWRGTLDPYLAEIGKLKQFPVWILNPMSGAVPSGTSLKVQERDLVSTIYDKQDKLTVAWQASWHVALQQANFYNYGLAEDGRLIFDWVNPATEAIIEDREIEVRTAISAGLSAETIWRDLYNLTDDAVEEEKERLQTDLNAWVQRSQIIETLTRATLNPEGALAVSGISDEDSLALRMVQTEPEETIR